MKHLKKRNIRKIIARKLVKIVKIIVWIIILFVAWIIVENCIGFDLS